MGNYTLPTDLWRLSLAMERGIIIFFVFCLFVCLFLFCFCFVLFCFFVCFCFVLFVCLFVCFNQNDRVSDRSHGKSFGSTPSNFILTIKSQHVVVQLEGNVLNWITSHVAFGRISGIITFCCCFCFCFVSFVCLLICFRLFLFLCWGVCVCVCVCGGGGGGVCGVCVWGGGCVCVCVCVCVFGFIVLVFLFCFVCLFDYSRVSFNSNWCIDAYLYDQNLNVKLRLWSGLKIYYLYIILQSNFNN